MKRLMYLLAASAIVLSGCSDDDDNAGNGGDNGSNDLRKISVKASEIRFLPSSPNISNVVFYAEYNNDTRDIELASTTWNNGFSITLPETVSSTYLSEIYTLLEDDYQFTDYSDISITNTNARVTSNTRFEARNTAYVGEIYVSGNEDDWSIRYIYSDSNVNVKGSQTEGNHEAVYDMALKRGWNRVAFRTVERLEDGMTHYIYTAKTDLPSSLVWEFER